jgi:hypothetical protein
MQHTWERSAYRVLVGKSEGNRPHGRPGRRWECNSKIALIGIGWAKDVG